MTATALLIFLLPLLVDAGINIRIQASKTRSYTNLEMSGESEELISDRDRTIFQLRDWEVKDAVAMLSGGRPDDVYLRGPTPWGDLYQTYNWKEVKRTIIPKTVKILDLNTETVVVNKSLSQQGDISVRHTWASGSSYYFDNQVTYFVSIGFGIKKSGYVYYKNWFGFEFSRTSEVPIGSDVTQSQAGRSAGRVLTAKRSVLKVEVAYEATLTGGVACNYANKFKGHHFWKHDVNQCLEAAGKPEKIFMKEVIEVVYYYDEEVSS